MKFLIFGGTGFVGKQLMEFVSKSGDEVVCGSRSSGFGYLQLNISQYKDFEKIDFRPDVIVNCASRIPQKGKSSADSEYIEELFLTNVVGGVNIAKWAVKQGIPEVINCSTLVVSKKPWPTPLVENFSAIPDGFHVGYAMSKLSQELLMNEIARDSLTKITHLRLSAVYGASMVQEGIIFNLLELFRSNKTVELTDASKISFDFIHVTDVCRSIYIASKKKNKEFVINCASGQPITLLELANILKTVTSSKSAIVNNNTGKGHSEANISVERLKDVLGNNYQKFIPFEKGIRDVVATFIK